MSEARKNYIETHPEEYKQLYDRFNRVRKNHTGMKRSEETKKKMSLAMKAYYIRKGIEKSVLCDK